MKRLIPICILFSLLFSLIVEAQTQRNDLGLILSTRDPLVTDNCNIYDVWWNTSSGNQWRGTDCTSGAAVWSLCAGGCFAASSLAGAVSFPGDISPAQITANQNDYDPPGLGGATILRLSADTSRNITGIAGGSDGRLLLVHNVGVTGTINFVDESSLSSAANRFALPADTSLPPDAIAVLNYDSTSTRWRIVSGGSGSGGTGTLDQAFDAGTGAIDSAICGTKEFRVGTSGSYLFDCDDPTFGPTRGATSGGGPTPISLEIQSGKQLLVKGAGGATTFMIIDGDTGAQSFADLLKPRGTIIFTPDSFYMQGCTKVTDQPIVSGGLVEPYITCGDNDAHGFHRSLEMPDSWDGGVLTVLLSVVNVNATPANNYEIDFSAACLGNAVAYATTISITGEQAALIDFDAGQSCGGSACAQNQRVRVTTASITPNGTCTGTGRMLRLQGQVDATATTTAQVADIKIIGLKVEFLKTSWGD